MTQLLAMSFDAPTGPSISLSPRINPAGSGIGAGWGFAWYPGQSPAASVIRDPRPVSEPRLTAAIRDWNRFWGTVFLCHLRGAAKRPTEQDTHPFTRAYAGRDFSFAHNGQLDPSGARGLDLGDDSPFEPLGSTDSERAFCWLLTRLRSANARRLADAGFDVLQGWLRELNALGTFNIVLSDGLDTIAYADRSGFRPLHYVRRTPPHPEEPLQNAILKLEMSGPTDVNRTMVLVSTTPLEEEGWTTVGPGEMVVARRGEIVFDSAGPSSGARAAGVQTPRAAAKPQPERITYDVLHETTYTYEEAVESSVHTLRLQPVHSHEQRVLTHSLDVSVNGEARDYEDVFGNRSRRLWLTSPYKELKVSSKTTVQVERPRPLTAHERTRIPLVWMPWQRQMMTPYLLPFESPESQLRELSQYAIGFAERQNDDVVATLKDMNRTIRRDFEYVQGVTNVETTPFEVYASRRGVCQDFANLFICLARLLGLPARYRVGYIHTGSEYENQLQSEASHAWAEVFIPWEGWRGFDPTNGCLAGVDHISVAAGRNYRDATPTSGTLYKGGRGERLKVRVEVKVIG